MELDLLSLSPIVASLLVSACAAAPAEPRSTPIRSAGHEPSSIVREATPPPEPAAVSDAGPVAAEPVAAQPPAAEPPPAPSEPPPIPEGTTVLHIGDSMAGALGVALNDELKQRKVKGMLRFKAATYIPGWAWGKELPLYLAQVKPDLVLITLGTNEVKMPDPTMRAPTIRKLVGLLGGRPCVWIAPPVWAPEKGLYQVIRDNIAPCRYMDTERVYPDMPRLGDKIHPSINARKEWAKRVVNWLARERQPTTEAPWALRPESGAGD